MRILDDAVDNCQAETSAGLLGTMAHREEGLHDSLQVLLGNAATVIMYLDDCIDTSGDGRVPVQCPLELHTPGDYLDCALTVYGLGGVEHQVGDGSRDMGLRPLYDEVRGFGVYFNSNLLASGGSAEGGFLF